MSQQQTQNEARRREAEEAVSLLYSIVEEHAVSEDAYKCLEFLAWEAGVLEYFKRLRSE